MRKRTMTGWNNSNESCSRIFRVLNARRVPRNRANCLARHSNSLARNHLPLFCRSDAIALWQPSRRNIRACHLQIRESRRVYATRVRQVFQWIKCPEECRCGLLFVAQSLRRLVCSGGISMGAHVRSNRHSANLPIVIVRSATGTRTADLPATSNTAEPLHVYEYQRDEPE
jgi:hypothetical protein